MTIEANKTLVLTACRHLSERNLPALFDLIHDDGSWSVPYRGDRFQFGGFRDKAGVSALLNSFLFLFDQFSFDVEHVTAEGDRVVVEAKSIAHGPGDAHYENNYLMIFFIKDDKLHTVREYFDPFQVLDYVEQMEG